MTVASASSGDTSGVGLAIANTIASSAIRESASGGITLAQMLGMLETTDLKTMKPGTLEETDLLARVGAV